MGSFITALSEREREREWSESEYKMMIVPILKTDNGILDLT